MSESHEAAIKEERDGGGVVGLEALFPPSAIKTGQMVGANGVDDTPILVHLEFG